MNPELQPLVSILTPVYNGEEYLAECIESVLGQTYQNWEYCIVNNCSTDRTLEIANGYAKRIDGFESITTQNSLDATKTETLPLDRFLRKVSIARLSMEMTGCSRSVS